MEILVYLIAESIGNSSVDYFLVTNDLVALQLDIIGVNAETIIILFLTSAMIAVLWICWFLIINGVMTEPRNFRLVLDEIIVSDRDPDLMEKLEIQLSQRNNRSYVDAQIIFKRNFKEMSARTALDFRKSSNTKIRLYDVRLDACLFLDVSHKNRLFNIYAKALRKYSNLSCPFKANFTYTFKQLYFDEQEIPSIIPLGVFRALIEYSTKQRLSARIKIRGKIVPRL